MKKLSTRWVPRLLTLNNKRNGETTSQPYMTLFKHNLHHFMTVDEISIYWYTLKTKEHLILKPDFTRPRTGPKKAKIVPYIKKLLTLFLCDWLVGIYIDYLKMGPTRTYYDRFWADSTYSYSKHDRIRWRRNGSSTMISHRRTPPQLPRSNWSN